jgi:hypothetical protein
MPPEPDDARARRLEALRRYFAERGRRDGPAVETAEPKSASGRRRRPSPSWLLVTGLLVVVALVGGVVVGAVAWSEDRPASGGTGTGASSATQRPTTTAGPMASAACKTAVDRADATLASAVRLRGALAEQARILRNHPAAGCPGPRCWSSSLRGCRPGRASRPGLTAPWPPTGRSWTSASCKPPEPVRAGQGCMVAKTITLDR